MPLISLLLCQMLYGGPSYIMSDMLCAGDIRNVKTVCEVHPTERQGPSPELSEVHLH